MVNRVVLAGRLVKDPELKPTESGVAFCVFTLAADNRLRESDGKRGTIFIDCRVFGKQAETLAQFARKGSKIAVDGSLNQRAFERKDGSLGKVIEVIVDSVTLLDSKKESSSIEEPNVEDLQAPVANNLDDVDVSDDDLPF